MTQRKGGMAGIRKRESERDRKGKREEERARVGETRLLHTRCDSFI